MERRLDSSDYATILAALRMFQEKYKDCSAGTIQADFPEHFEIDANGDVEPMPLGTEDIDSLCESINLQDIYM